MNRLIASVSLSMVALASGSAPAGTFVTVPGTSNPWLAGMPDGSSAGDGQDFAPTNSPVLAPVPVAGGDVFTFEVTGSVLNGDGPLVLTPDGDLFQFFSRIPGPENGIADMFGPINSFAAVFLDDSQPDGSPTPDGLNFSDAGLGINFSSLSPLLKQPFFIGDGQTNDTRVIQQFIAPAGATRLFLGTMDGFGWFNNIGEFRVRIVPTPGATAFAGLVALTLVRRRR
ncbi:MAG: PEP-CTERM sorting domain-containing protein [Phycisphaerales bacterium]